MQSDPHGPTPEGEEPSRGEEMPPRWHSGWQAGGIGFNGLDFQNTSQSTVWALTKGIVLALQRQQSREKLPKIRKPGAQLGNKGIPQRPRGQWPDYKQRETLTVQKAGHWNIKLQKKPCDTGVQIPGPTKEKTLINH